MEAMIDQLERAVDLGDEAQVDALVAELGQMIQTAEQSGRILDLLMVLDDALAA